MDLELSSIIPVHTSMQKLSHTFFECHIIFRWHKLQAGNELQRLFSSTGIYYQNYTNWHHYLFLTFRVYLITTITEYLLLKLQDIYKLQKLTTNHNLQFTSAGLNLANCIYFYIYIYTCIYIIANCIYLLLDKDLQKNKTTGWRIIHSTILK